MFHHRVAITAVATAALAAVALPGAATAKQAAATQVREVCAQSTYVTDRPATRVRDTLYKGERVDVSRYSASGAWAYGKPRGATHAHLTGGWVKVADLCAKGSAAKPKRYSVRISPGGSGELPVHVGGVSNITVKDAQRAGQSLQLCITPAPTERPRAVRDVPVARSTRSLGHRRAPRRCVRKPPP